METNTGNPGLEQEDGSERRRTEDEDNTLGMTQKVSESQQYNKVKGEYRCLSPTMSERDWTLK